jgi:hypothetical protein
LVLFFLFEEELKVERKMMLKMMMSNSVQDIRSLVLQQQSKDTNRNRLVSIIVS